MPDDYLSFLERILTPGRLRHSLGVQQVIGELAEVYSLDRQLAQTAGLLHDAAKDLSPAQQEQIIQQAGIQITCPEEQDYNLYLHGPVGAAFVRQELGVDDPLILGAIHMHTFCGNGANFHSPLVWCLRFSDLLEPNRDWSEVRWMRENMPRLRALAYAGRMTEAAILHTSTLIEWFDTAGYPVHPNMRKARQDLSQALLTNRSPLDAR
ncbi:MAG: bis(5'-nucleosyl)-tetraphosphatase (symmetrical) YqeK [Anaerolineales bacterium]|nr:bis(5'-nucleosyl)-tetraphosphatase (symmetrical) YqeK [Anaerolineales bacterium]